MLFMKWPCIPSKLLPHCSKIYVKKIIDNSFYLLPLCSQRLFGHRLWMLYVFLQIYCHNAHRIIFKNIRQICVIYLNLVLFINWPCMGIVHVYSKILPLCSHILILEIFVYYVLFTATLLIWAIWTELRGILHILLSYFKIPVTPLTD